MFTKKVLFLGGVLVSAFVGLIGCADEDLPAQQPQQIEVAACMKGASASVERYFAASADPAEIKAIWACAREAILTFKKMVSGEENNTYYKPKELVNFLETQYLTDGTKISETLTREFMEIKRLFIGGEVDRISRDELLTLVSLTNAFESITLELMPAMPILAEIVDFKTGKLVPPSSAEFMSAERALFSVVDQVATILARNKRDYPFESMRRLADEISEIAENKGEAKKWANYVQVLEKAKQVLLGRPNEIAHFEWRTLLTVGARLFVSKLRMDYFVDGDHWWKNKSLFHIDQIVQDVLGLLRQAVDRRRTGVIDNSEIEALVIELVKQKIIPLKVKNDAIASLWKVVADRLLQPIDDFSRSSGLDRDKLHTLEREYRYWRAIQYHINHKFGDDPVEGIIPEKSATAIEELNRVIAGPWPLRSDSDGGLIIDMEGGSKHNQLSLTDLNWERALIRLVIRGYATNFNDRRLLTGLTLEEVKALYEDLKPLVDGLGLVTGDPSSFYKTLFSYGNLVLPRSNGDDKLGFEEGIEYVHYILSGTSTATKMIEGMRVECKFEVDPVSGEETVRINCFRDEFQRRFNTTFKSLPNLVAFKDSLGDKVWAQFLMGLEKTVRDPDRGYQVPITFGEINQLTIFMQFLETLMARFDTDRDNHLGLEEGLESFNVFKTTLHDVLGEEYGLPMFTFMLRYGYNPLNPESQRPTTGIEWQHWQRHPEKWKYSADRLTLVNILASLKPLLEELQ